MQSFVLLINQMLLGIFLNALKIIFKEADLNLSNYRLILVLSTIYNSVIYNKLCHYFNNNNRLPEEQSAVIIHLNNSESGPL